MEIINMRANSRAPLVGREINFFATRDRKRRVLHEILHTLIA